MLKTSLTKAPKTLSYTNNSPDELRVVYFHLYWNAFKAGSMMDQRIQSQGTNGDGRLQEKGISRLASIPSNEEGQQNIHWIKQNGKPLKLKSKETIMKVELAEAIKPNSTTTFTMEWDAVIPKQIRRSGRNNRENIAMSMTQWYPKIAEYDYQGWHAFDYIGREFHAPFADFDINIKIDKDYIIGAGGTLKNPNEVKGYSDNARIAEDENGKATWKWTARNMLDFAWAADPKYTVESFTILDGPEIFLVYHKNEKTLFWEESKPYITKFFQIMNATFGRYAYPSYSFIQGGDGGMEYGMSTLILGEHRSLERLVGLMVHEGAHSWFQQMLASNESTQPWIDEGFTSYAESLVMHQLFPPKEATPNPFWVPLILISTFPKQAKKSLPLGLADHHDDGRAYSVASYTKGELFLVQLGYIMGEQNLSLVMRDFFNQWKMKHPSDKDFLHIVQKVSGMDLKWFQHYWINTTKTIDYAIEKVEYAKIALPSPLPIKAVSLCRLTLVSLPKTTPLLPIISYEYDPHLERQDLFGSFQTLPYWAWTQKEYQLTVPYTKEQITAMGIDFSKEWQM
ncbi:aminopeptidase [Bergeyella porcorum]|uniref:Aminopeptidase n=1 Tax=Bergeyella porcorum TaxID=1735111 RepID=A0AAU0F4X4_9FLAO